MGKQALALLCLEALVKLAMPLLKRAEREHPRQGRGRRPVIPDWVLGALIMTAVLKRKKSKSAQYGFLLAHQNILSAWLGIDHFPSRSTYFDRYRRGHLSLPGCDPFARRTSDSRRTGRSRLCRGRQEFAPRKRTGLAPATAQGRYLPSGRRPRQHVDPFRISRLDSRLRLRSGPDGQLPRHSVPAVGLARSGPCPRTSQPRSEAPNCLGIQDTSWSTAVMTAMR